MKKLLPFLSIVLVLITLFTSCYSEVETQKNKALIQWLPTWETVGVEDNTVFLYIPDPIIYGFSYEDLLVKQIDNAYKDVFNTGIVNVMVFDNKEAPQRWIGIQRLPLPISDQEWEKADREWAQESIDIYPHWVADYWYNKHSGLHQIDFLSRDAEGKVTKTIKY